MCSVWFVCSSILNINKLTKGSHLDSRNCVPRIRANCCYWFHNNFNIQKNELRCGAHIAVVFDLTFQIWTAYQQIWTLEISSKFFSSITFVTGISTCGLSRIICSKKSIFLTLFNVNIRSRKHIHFVTMLGGGTVLVTPAYSSLYWIFQLVNWQSFKMKHIRSRCSYGLIIYHIFIKTRYGIIIYYFFTFAPLFYKTRPQMRYGHSIFHSFLLITQWNRILLRYRFLFFPDAAEHFNNLAETVISCYRAEMRLASCTLQ